MGAASLARDVGLSSTLNTLNLAENVIGSDGVLLLAEAISASSSIVTIDLRATELTEADRARLRRVAGERRAVAGGRRLTILTDYTSEATEAAESPRGPTKRTTTSGTTTQIC